MTISLILGLALAVFLFMWVPQTVTGLLAPAFGLESTDVLFNLIEGLIKILIFAAYILLTSLLKDIRRTYMYHGAEHKTINCYEYGLPLTVENVKKCSRIHDRCGTTFMFFVMFVSIIVFSLVNAFAMLQGFYRILLKICLLPVVAGLSYELLKGLAKTDSPLVLPLKAPGMLLQMITTREPDNSMIEVAINSFNTVLEMEADKSIQPVKFVTALTTCKLLEKVSLSLKAAMIDDAADAEWIVSIVSGEKRSEIATSQKLLSPKLVEKAMSYTEKRATGMPLWYVIGDTEFYGYRLKVDQRVLIPRPETEEVVSKALEYIDGDSAVLDLCTGSGAIAIAIKKQKGCKVTASDISDGALSLAAENAAELSADINFVKSNLFDDISGSFDVIVSNPPYVKTGDIKNLAKEVSFEPVSALDGGEDGLAFYRLIAAHFKDYLNPNGKLVFECGDGEAEDIAAMFAPDKTTIFKDLNGIDRIVVVEI